MRPAGSGRGLRPRRLALWREQARGRRKEHGPDGQDVHDALHPVHALRPLHHRSGGRAGHRHDLARRKRRDHDLSGKEHRQRTVGQRQRPVPGGRPDAPPVAVSLPPLGAEEDRDHRCDGRARLEHPRRLARRRGHARPAARERGHQRGVAVGQEPLRRRRPASASSGPPVGARKRQAACGFVGRGAERRRRQDQGRLG